MYELKDRHILDIFDRLHGKLEKLGSWWNISNRLCSSSEQDFSILLSHLSSLFLIYPLLTCVDLCISSPPPWLQFTTPLPHSTATSLVLYAPALPPTSQCFCFHCRFKAAMFGQLSCSDLKSEIHNSTTIFISVFIWIEDQQFSQYSIS